MFVFIVELLNLLLMFLFYHKFRLCITNASGKAHTPCRAGVYSRRLIGLDPMLQREQAQPYDIPHYNTNRQRKQHLCRNLCVTDRRGRRSLHFGKHPCENQSKSVLFYLSSGLSRSRFLQLRVAKAKFLLKIPLRCLVTFA